MKLAHVSLVFLLACGGKAKPAPANVGSGSAGDHPAGSIAGTGIGADLTKCGSLDKDALCKCLSPDAEVAECDFADDGSVAAAHVLRAGNDEQTDTFLVVADGDKLHAIAELLYEQHHGKRDSDLSNPKLTLQTVGSTRILRLEYTVSASTDYADEQYDEQLDGTAVKVCALDGTLGCLIDTFSTCKVERTDYSDPPNPSNNAKGDTTATITIGADGTATITPGASNGDPADCAIEAKTVKLVP